MSDDDAQYGFTVPPPGAEDDAPAPSTSSSKPSKKRKVKDAAPAADDAEEAPEPAAAEEERPLSHKEKRLAKKRKLAAEAAGEGGEDGGAVSASASAPAAKAPAPAPTMIGSTLVGNTPARSAHGVWVGNLNFATHARELLSWFSERGLKEVTRINMPNGKRAHENNRGFAYLDFPTETDVTIAVGLSEQHLDGRKLLIKSSSDYTGRPAPSAASTSSSTPAAVVHADESTLPPLDPSALGPAAPPAAPGAPQTLNRTARKILDRQKNPPGPTLFIGNLGFETKVEDIRDMFDRNQKRAAEWAPKEKGKKGEKSGKKPVKGKGKEEEGSDEEDDDDEKADTDRDEDDSDDSDDDEEEEEGKENGAEEGEKKREKKAKGKKEPLDFAKAKDAGIRKVRLGTFEDSGKCKGWCFVDFHLPAQATRALLNLRNHTLNGRKLNVEFASADAVRRGGLGSRAAGKAAGRARREGGGGRFGDEDGDEQGQRGRKRPRFDNGGGEWDDGAVRDLAAAGGFARDGPLHAHGGRRGGAGGFDRDDGRGKKGGVGDGKRAKPGAALANAQRASEAIVASTGRKTTFD
ncbi:hypothetical protein JCM6882_005048 [Rhodosporidiobolus microsporus]